MSEVAIILSDVHAAADPHFGDAPAALPALARLGRFGQTAAAGQWRAWLAGWLGRPDLAGLAGSQPAVVAGATQGGEAGSLWLAAPVHLQAGMRSVHLSHQGLLRVEDAQAAALARDFDANFAARGFALRPAAGGGFLALGPRFASLPTTTDPSCLLGEDIGGSIPRGDGAATLLRLGAELEMWLYEHPLNTARVAARQRAITTLWLWGGGGQPVKLAMGQAAADSAVLGSDAFCAGLCAVSGARSLPEPFAATPQVLAACGRFARVAVIVELFRLGRDQGAQAGAPGTVHELLKILDDSLLAPLQQALRQGGLTRLHLLASGRVTSLQARDGLKFWRRSRGPLAVLQ